MHYYICMYVCIYIYIIYIYIYICMFKKHISIRSYRKTVEDFWRMLWEQKVPTVVMLTKLFEGKVSCYMGND